MQYTLYVRVEPSEPWRALLATTLHVPRYIAPMDEFSGKLQIEGGETQLSLRHKEFAQLQVS